MITQRRVVTLLVVALAIIAIAFTLASRRPSAHEDNAGHVLLNGLKPALNDVTELRISKGDGTRVTLHKRENDWAVSERDYPADSGRVRKLLFDLSSLAVVEEKTSDPSSYSRIGVDDVKTPTATGARIEAVTPKQTYAVIVGRTSGTKNSFVRVPDAKTSYLATPQITADADPKRWLDRTLMDIPEARIKDVVVTPASGPSYTVGREKKEQSDFTVTPIPKGRELSSPGSANGTAGELVSLTLDDVRKPPAGPAGIAAAAASAADSAAAKPDATVKTDAGAKPAATAKSDASAKPDAATKAGVSAKPDSVAKAGVSGKPDATATFHTFDGLEIVVTGAKDGERRFVSFTPKSTAKETEAEAKTLLARTQGWQFEIPNYKYDQFFKPQEDLLKKPEPKADAKAKVGGPKKPAAEAPALEQSPTG